MRADIRLVAALLAAACLPAAASADQSTSGLRSLHAGWIAAGTQHTCAVLADASASCWGYNYHGELGISTGPGPSEYQYVPAGTLLAQGRTAVAVTAGQQISCAILDDGSAACWGRDTDGQVGDGPFREAGGYQFLPTAVSLPAGRRATAISAGGSHACAVLDDGSAVCWGIDASGQLGNGLVAGVQTAPSAVIPPPGRAATTISAGFAHSCAILDDGSALCWGSDYDGQLGDGPGALEATSPGAVRLPPGRTAVAISAGGRHTCAVLDDGLAYCWGRNEGGQLGNADSRLATQDVPSPVALPAGRTAIAISAGSGHSCAILDSGSAMCWGGNPSGQLGSGSRGGQTVSPSAVRLPVGRSALAISAATYNTCAILDDGSVTCWGDDSSVGKLKPPRLSPDALPPAKSAHEAARINADDVPSTVAAPVRDTVAHSELETASGVHPLGSGVDDGSPTAPSATVEVALAEGSPAPPPQPARAAALNATARPAHPTRRR